MSVSEENLETKVRLGECVVDVLLGQKSSGLCLSHFYGNRVVVFFVDSLESEKNIKFFLSFRDLFSRFLSSNAVIIGVTRDSEDVCQNFKKNYHIPFNLISDPQGMITRCYEGSHTHECGVAFLVDESGVLAKQWCEEHDEGDMVSDILLVLEKSYSTHEVKRAGL